MVAVKSQKGGPVVRLTALACSLLVALAGCSGEEEPPKPPAGFTTYKGDVYTFVHPQGWSVTHDKDDRGAPLVEAHGPVGANGAYRGQVIVSRTDRFGGSMDAMKAQARGLNQLSGRRIVREGDAKVPGAEEAWRLETAYEEKTSTGATARVRSIDIYALTSGGTMLDLTVRASQEEFDAAGMPKVVSSFWVRP
ncbi:hypothetical protein [Actinomadura sp. NBRC 104425]|uniref:hypothetical protein n=1 Tax=Actinomadura sp. NBRC 104425 TaxID=3032204 RepID=UPI00255394C6|nr:hypothetical protein [Actinomadura sp. NBRC 104425]